MDTLNDVLYHLSCPSCGADWWDKDAFPSYCPYCNTNRFPKKYIGENVKQKQENGS